MLYEYMKKSPVFTSRSNYLKYVWMLEGPSTTAIHCKLSTQRSVERYFYRTHMKLLFHI